MKNIYDVDPGEVYWAASDIGWTVGHSYTVYGPLIHGCTTVLYEGKPVGTPDAGAFWRVIEQHDVCTLFTAPTAFRAIRQQDPTASRSNATTCRVSARCSLRASAATPRRSVGQSSNWACL
jgi:propionyl-CoA synthetase